MPDRRLVRILFTCIPLTGCIVLPFGVHVNRPFPMEDPGRIRVGIGISQFPEGQGAVAAVDNDLGTAANPVPQGASNARVGSFILDGTVSVLRRVDLGVGARGLYLLWASIHAGDWVFSVSPAYGTSTSTSTGGSPRLEKDDGKLANVNLMATAAWRLTPEDPERLFGYLGVGANMFSTKISVTQSSPAYTATGTDSASAPTVLLGVGGKALGTTLNLEAGGTFVKERTGRSDAVLTVAALLSWSVQFFGH